MKRPTWLGRKEPTLTPRKGKGPREGETIAVDVTQDGNSIKVEADRIRIFCR
jgi:hypothetical protein